MMFISLVIQEKVMKKQIFVSAVVAALLLGTTVLQAESGEYGLDSGGGVSHPTERIKHTDSFGDTYYSWKYKNSKPCVDKEAHAQHQKLKETPPEVVQAMNETFDAIKALRKGDITIAKNSLTAATDLFDKAIKANPKLMQVPVAVDIEVNELDMTPEQITTVLKQADEAIYKKHTQDARDLLMPLRDEMTTTTQYLPMGLYPEATKTALDTLKKGDRNKALHTLVVALGTIVSEETIVPIPLLAAQESMEGALKLDKNKKKEALQMIDASKSQLKKAVLLGYTDEESAEYKHLKIQIENVQKGVEGENRLEKFYDELKDSFFSLIKKAQSESHKLLAARKTK